jgi:hypothetical protein
MFVCVFKINSNPFIQPGLNLVVLGWTQLYLAGRFLFVFSCSLGIFFFCRFEAMNHFVGLKLPHLSCFFTTTITSSAPPSSKSWPKQGLLLFYLFVPYIARSQETIDCCHWLAGPDGSHTFCHVHTQSCMRHSSYLNNLCLQLFMCFKLPSTTLRLSTN